MRDDTAQLSLLDSLTQLATGLASALSERLGARGGARTPPRQRASSRGRPPPDGPGASPRPRGGTAAPARGAVAKREGAAAVRQPELDLAPAERPAPRGVVEVAPPVRAALERRLHPSLGAALALTITDNRRTMISVRRVDGQRQVRLHHMFVDAPPEVLEAVGRYLARGDRYASRLVDRYIAANQHRIRPARSGAEAGGPRLKTRGRVHDLAEIQRALSARYFGGAVALDITWGRFGPRKRRSRTRRTIRMGTYFIEEQLIRIHPALDQAFVPRYFVEWVVFHEMLHHVVPMPLVNGRRIYHTEEFRERERGFHEYERARAWEDAHLKRLISSQRASAD